MDVDREKLTAATAGTRDAGSREEISDPLGLELRNSRRVALNMMEDAIAARELAERANIVLRETETRRNFLLMLADAFRVAPRSSTIPEIAAKVLGEHVGASRAMYIGIEGEEAGILGSWSDGGEELPQQLSFSSLARDLIQSSSSEELMFSCDTEVDERFAGADLDLLRSRQVRAFVTVRLFRDRKCSHAFTVHSNVPRDWTATELYLITETAERTRTAMERARVDEVLRRKTLILEAINSIFAQAIVSRSEEKIIRICLQVAEDLTESKFAFIAEINPRTGRLDITASDRTKTGSSVSESAYPPMLSPALFEGDGIYGRVLKNGEALIANAPALDAEAIGTPEGDALLKSFVGVPLFHEGSTIGMIGLGNRSAGYREEDREAAEALVPAILQALLRKRSDKALRQSEQRLSLLTESFHDFAIFTTDESGRVATWNPGAKNIFGYEENEILGQSAHILFVPEDRVAGVPEREMSTARTNGRAADERWHLRKDGTKFYASGIMAPLYLGDALIGYAKIARDLTAQKQTAEELQLHRERLEILIAGRTAELAEANETLRDQMTELKKIEKERVELLQKIVTTQEDERRRIARDMHDSLGQQLTAMRLKLASTKADMQTGGPLAESLEDLQQLGKAIDADVNFLVWELRPTVLDDLGLGTAIEAYLGEWSRHYNIPAEFHSGRMGDERLDGNVETNLYRIAQEALNNIYKHASAKSAIVVLETRKNEIVLVIEDDGVGFDPERSGNYAETGHGLGLVGMRERAAIINGTVEIESSPGAGTTVFVRAPVERRGTKGWRNHAGVNTNSTS